ncbi:MAG: BadF/BadG/BcrA/BcrD ATPase family protein [Terriglobia bacterium]
MKLFLAVDGGQTSTRLLLADETGAILAQIAGGASNHTEEPKGRDRLERVVVSCLETALAAAHLSPLENQEFSAACFGMTGETEIKREVLARIISTPHLLVVHDSVNALAGATEGEPGVIVIAGTGSVARGLNAEGKEMRAGGWGHLFGDEGSAYWIGREAVRAAAAQYDGFGDATTLTNLLTARLGASPPYEIMARYYSGELSREHLAGLAVVVSEAAKEGDCVSQAILRDAGAQLARLANAVLSRLFPLAEEAAEPQESAVVSYTGGVFQDALVLSAFTERVLAEHPRSTVRPPLLPPVFGSLILAYRSAGVSVASAIRARWREMP